MEKQGGWMQHALMDVGDNERLLLDDKFKPALPSYLPWLFESCCSWLLRIVILRLWIIRGRDMPMAIQGRRCLGGAHMRVIMSLASNVQYICTIENPCSNGHSTLIDDC